MTPIAGRGEVQNPFSHKRPSEFGRGVGGGGKGGIKLAQTHECRVCRPSQEGLDQDVFVCFSALYQLETSALVNPPPTCKQCFNFLSNGTKTPTHPKAPPASPGLHRVFSEGKADEMNTQDLDSEGVWR